MFKISKEVDKWFKNIKDNFKLDFDIYYMCLVVGLSAGLKQKLTGIETKDIIKALPKEYRQDKQIIIALFLRREIESLGISLEDRKGVHDVILRYTNTSFGDGINDEAHKIMNEYANAGFEKLKEKFEERPQTIEPFLINYADIVADLNKKRIEGKGV